MQLRSIALAFVCAFSLSSALSAQAPEFSDVPFSATPADFARAAAAMPPDHQFDAQILFESGTYRIAENGTLIYEFRLIFRVDSPDGVRGWSEISSSWDPWYEKPAQLHARVLSADGHFVELDQKTITDAPVKAEDTETFSSQHVRRAPLPGVAVGSIVEQVTTTEETQPYFTGGENYRFGFRSGVPVGRERVLVDLPAATPFKDVIRNIPGLQVARTETAGRRHIVYEASALPPSHPSDIDLSTNIPSLPMLEFGTGASWASVASIYAGLSDPQTIVADAQAILPATLPSDRMARIRAIVQRLHREVRYTGVEFGAARLTPQRPSEVLQRHYGDCKDKATLLVAMLRAAQIPANLALLSAGPGRDVDPTLPGMNEFDHAIVYVPAAGSQAALWIDATANFTEVGSLPFDDQGRSALIISPETKALTLTPAPRPEDSVLVESRTFKLAGLGPAHVEESSETHGYIDSRYRADYGGPDSPKLHEQMENYVRQAYLAKTLTTIHHGDGADLEQPFTLTLAADGARRGSSDLGEAVVALFPSSPANGLPKWFATPPPVITPETSAETRAKLELASKSREETYSFWPFITEQRVRIEVPAGFTLRSLPPQKTTQLGSASLTETYTNPQPDLVTATFRFNSGPSVLSAEQALALRTAILELNKREYVGIFFDQVGAKAMAAGHIREALAADRALIAGRSAATPPTDDALNHLRLGRLLLEAGIGDEARVEAREATTLDPKSSPAFTSLGWILEHNSRGERFGKGFDLGSAIDALKHAIALDPDDNNPRFDLGILYEFNARGTRYAADSDMAAAAKVYRELVERSKDRNATAAAEYRENLLYVLLYSKQFAELDTLLATLPASNAHTTLAISSAAAQHGAKAGIAQAERGNVSAADRNKDLRNSGTQLANMHRYSEAADVMTAGMQGGEDAPTVAREIEMYRGLKPASFTPLPATNPAMPVHALTVGMMAGTLTHDQAAAALSHHAYSSPAGLERDVQKNISSEGFMRAVAAKSDMSESVLIDLLIGTMTFNATGDDTAGYSIVAQMPGSDPSHYFVVKEDGVYRVVADDHDNAQVGNAALYALEHKQPAEAKALLDWKRDLTKKQGGEDAFEGPLLPRFWTVGSSKPGADSPEAMRLAALALLAGSMDEAPFLAELQAVRDKATGQRQTDLDLLLASAAVGSEVPDVALPAARRLLENEPDSLTALRLAGASFAFLHDTAGWQAMLAPRLQKKPRDHDLLNEQARAQETAHDFVAAQATLQKVLDSGKAESNDYNGFAWLGLFHGSLGADITKAAQQSNMMSKNSSFADLHTLACVYASQGRTTEARQVLDQAMYAGSQSEPNSEVWYALGVVYEQYGVTSAALEAFKRVQAHEQDDHLYVDPTSTYILAQARIAAIEKH